jgi:hypothetical protein
MVMNLILNTDVNATNKKLEKYQKANNHFVDKGLKDATGQKAKKRAVDDSVADPSGLIQGLRKIVAPVRIPDYDAFEGMHAAYDYFTLKEEYQEHWTKGGISSSALAGGFDFQASLTTLSFPRSEADLCIQATAEEALLTAFAGLGVFIEDEKAQPTDPTASAFMLPAKQAVDDVF